MKQEFTPDCTSCTVLCIVYTVHTVHQYNDMGKQCHSDHTILLVLYYVYIIHVHVHTYIVDRMLSVTTEGSVLDLNCGRLV